MSNTLSRQWIPVAGGSCDLRMGYDAFDQAYKIMGDSVGSPRVCMIVARSSIDEDLRELLRRQAVHAGFLVHWHMLEADDVRTIEQASRLYEALAHDRITGDDLCCAVGDADLLSVVSYVCASWCGGMPYVAVVMDEIALLEGALVPRALNVGTSAGVVSVQASARNVLFDCDLSISDLGSPASLHARAIMVAASMASSERAFSTLWDRAEAICKGDRQAMIDQLLDTAKSRGQTASSTAFAIRQSIEYGQSFARALSSVGGRALAPSVLLAEGMRFCARIAVALQKLTVDDMLAQDELLQALGVGVAECDAVPQRLVDALREEHFVHSNRFMLLVPFAIGRVRLASVPDDLLMEHAQAWCDAHRPI